MLVFTITWVWDRARVYSAFCAFRFSAKGRRCLVGDGRLHRAAAMASQLNLAAMFQGKKATVTIPAPKPVGRPPKPKTASVPPSADEGPIPEKASKVTAASGFQAPAIGIFM